MNYDWYNNLILEYRKMINVLDNTSNQPSKFRTKNQVEINDESRGTCNINRQIRFKTTIPKPSLCDYNDANISVKGNITVNNTATDGAAGNNTRVIFNI